MSDQAAHTPADRVARAHRRLLSVEIGIAGLAVVLVLIALAIGLFGVGDFGHGGIQG